MVKKTSKTTAPKSTPAPMSTSAPEVPATPIKAPEPVIVAAVPDFTQAETETESAPTADTPGISDGVGQQFEGIIQTLGTFRHSITALQSQIRGLEKSVRKEIKSLQKEAAKNRNKGNRRPSGFAKPSKVSSELCSFMNKDPGTEIARTEVTQFLIQYIKDNQLQFEANKKIIIPDKTLKKLLKVKDGDEVTYFNLQRLMNIHFIKAIPTTNTVSASQTV
jgi:chromatin remodeling complex protein RSC6